VCVCLSVCVSVCEDISGTARAIFTKFLRMLLYGRGSVVLWEGDEVPRGMGNFESFSSPLTMHVWAIAV